MTRKAKRSAILRLVAMKGSSKISPEDHKFVSVDPDPDFDPDHNRKVIADTIKHSEKLWREKQRRFAEGVRERVEAVSTYVESLKMGGASSDVQSFFGKQHLAHLRGYDLIERLKKAKQFGQPLIKRVENIYAKTKQKRIQEEI